MTYEHLREFSKKFEMTLKGLGAKFSWHYPLLGSTPLSRQLERESIDVPDTKDEERVGVR